MVIPARVRDMVEPGCRVEKQRQGCAAFLRWAANAPEARSADAGEIVIHRSVPQIAQGLGLPAAPTKGAAHQRWRNQVYRWARYLEHLGVTVETAPAGRDGRGTGILVRLPAGVAQSVRAAES